MSHVLEHLLIDWTLIFKIIDTDMFCHTYYLVAWFLGHIVPFQWVVLQVIQFPLGPVVILVKRLEPIQLLSFPCL